MSVDRPDPVVAKRLLICDSIEKRSDGGVNLINLWLLKRLPRGWTPASALPPWAVFVWATNGRGTVKFQVDLLAQKPDGTQPLVWRSNAQEVEFASPLETYFILIPATNVRIESPGDFVVELHCEDQKGKKYFLDDVAITFI
jgi:hypothetical protein